MNNNIQLASRNERVPLRNQFSMVKECKQRWQILQLRSIILFIINHNARRMP